jgi:hypothetical protein
METGDSLPCSHMRAVGAIVNQMIESQLPPPFYFENNNAGYVKIEVRSPPEAEDFSSSLCVQTGCGAHPAFLYNGYRGLFPRG